VVYHFSTPTPRSAQSLVLVLEDAPDLADESHEVDGADEEKYVAHGAQSFGGCWMADVDVAVSGQRDRQPHGSRVKYRRQIVGQTQVGEAPRVRYIFKVAIANRVEIQKARHRKNLQDLQRDSNIRTE